MPQVPAAARSVVPHIIDAAWQSELVAWVTGRSTLGDAYLRLEEVIRVVLAPYAAA
jgi:RecA-family ATPase